MYPDRRWINPMADATADNPSGKLDLNWRRVDRGGALDVNCRPWFFSNYYAVSPGMLSQIPGTMVATKPRLNRITRVLHEARLLG